jgi:type IV pilus assembly protein PilY1
MIKQICVALLALAAILGGGNAAAQSSSSSTASCGQAGGTCADNFQGIAATLNWTTLGTNNGSSSKNACLTAGNGTGSIQACPASLAGYSIPANETVVGQGALLLTPPVGYQTGAILSAFPPFPLSQGINITFTTYTFGGNSYNSGSSTSSGNGADGITFILTDGTKSAPTTTGGNGGAMGYDCSNANAGAYQGIANGYLGLGIDEYGNFLNSGNWVKASNGGPPSNAIVPYYTQPVNGKTYYWVYGDNGSSGVFNSNDTFNNEGSTANGTNQWGGTGSSQYQPERIGLRGSGNTTWAELQSLNSSYYSGSSPNSSQIYAACQSGQYVTGSDQYGNNTYAALPQGNYNAIPGGYAVLPTANLIANEAAGVTRNPTSTTTNGVTTNNPLAWPITYQLKISAAGLLSLSYSYNGGAQQAILTNTDITKSNGKLPTSLRFGFSAGTGGGTNSHEITCFKASPLASTSSAGANTIESGQYRTGTQIYLASYSASPWWGSLQAISLNVDSNGNLVAASAATWDGKCTLTGGGCDTMGTDANGNPLYSVTTANGFVTPENRVLVTATGNDVSGSGAGFSMQQALTNFPQAVQTVMGTATSGDSTSTGQQRLDWLLGMRCFEQLFSNVPATNGPTMYSADCSNTTAIGKQNPRTYVLGDIIDSSPTWVGAPVGGQYNNAFSDALWGSQVSPQENQSGAQTYGTYVSNNATRLNVVYVGSNDGYLHGFEAGSFTSSGTYSSTSNDGKEVIGYMPYNVLLTQAAQLTNPLYSHQYLVDATPGAGDLFYNNLWHTWLVGGVGSNGKEIYALDITDPTKFTQTSAAGLVLGDWTNATLPHLGNTVGTPSVVRMHNGDWAIILGNGLNSNTSAGVYIGLVNTSGAISFIFLDTGVGSSTLANGIAYVTPVDLDGDGIIDYLYAGDQQGNVWRFDVTSNSSTAWSVSNYGSTGASTCSNSSNVKSGKVVTAGCSPLFTATSTVSGSSSASAQPITSAIVTATIQASGNRAMVYFGTGEQSPQTANSGVEYAPQSTGSSSTATQQQAFYGIWDWNMAGWNAMSTTQLASETGTYAISLGSLSAITSTQTQVTGLGQIVGFRYLSSGSTICWAASDACSSGNSQYGWYYNLPTSNEQIIYNPAIIGGAVVVNTAIPPAVSATQCTVNTQTGWTMAFDATTGGAVPGGFFPESISTSPVSGVQTNSVGTVTAVSNNGNLYLISQTATGTAAINRVTPPNNNGPARVSWREIRN